MNPLGQIGQQIADNSIEIVKDTAKAVVKAGSDIASGTAEQITGVPNSQGASQGDKGVEKAQGAVDPNITAQRKAADRRRLQEVQGELEKYRNWKRQQDAKIAQEKASQEQEKKKTESIEKQKRESWTQKLLRKVGAGSHGETDKQKE